jgi:hypothetical protein
VDSHLKGCIGGQKCKNNISLEEEGRVKKGLFLPFTNIPYKIALKSEDYYSHLLN